MLNEISVCSGRRRNPVGENVENVAERNKRAENNVLECSLRTLLYE